ncbi:MAG TPA: class I SAM-dependent methyltransferase [Chloroflexaceae bacterium]|nr:class I SAM-dependent methyltransferase [Chloroflexaceae bacterium]
MQSVSFERAAAFYDATRGYAPGTAERICAAIVARTGATRQSRFLELGVGTGRIALPFLAAGYSYAGVDLAASMLAVLREKAAAAASRPMLVRGDVTRLPFADASFDVALGVHVLHLVADWRATLAEARRVLRPRAHLLLAGDVRSEDEPRADLVGLPPPAQARHVWRAALAGLGLSGHEGQPGATRLGDPAVSEALAALGATVEAVDLAEYERLPMSAREVVRGYSERIYSSDWARPDDLHGAAVARVERWLAEECADPDTPHAVRGRFTGLLATWG